MIFNSHCSHCMQAMHTLVLPSVLPLLSATAVVLHGRKQQQPTDPAMVFGKRFRKQPFGRGVVSRNSYHHNGMGGAWIHQRRMSIGYLGCKLRIKLTWLQNLLFLFLPFWRDAETPKAILNRFSC